MDRSGRHRVPFMTLLSLRDIDVTGFTIGSRCTLDNLINFVPVISTPSFEIEYYEFKLIYIFGVHR